MDSFSTVSDFLKKTLEAKSQKREAITASLDPILSNKGVAGLPPDLVDTIENLIGDYGDETLRQIGLFALGKWFELLIEEFQEYAQINESQKACECLMKAIRISDALHLASEVESMDGDEEWRQMLAETIGQFLLEKAEEKGQ